MLDQFHARRSPVYSRHGSVACTQPLAAEVGLNVLKEGGNVVDAAVAVAAAMNGGCHVGLAWGYCEPACPSPLPLL